MQEIIGGMSYRGCHDPAEEDSHTGRCYPQVTDMQTFSLLPQLSMDNKEAKLSNPLWICEKNSISAAVGC